MTAVADIRPFLAPIIWNKIANVVHEVENGGAGFLGKLYEPNAVIKNDIEFILEGRKGVRSLSLVFHGAVLWFRDQDERHCSESNCHHQTASRV